MSALVAHWDSSDLSGLTDEQIDDVYAERDALETAVADALEAYDIAKGKVAHG